MRVQITYEIDIPETEKDNKEGYINALLVSKAYCHAIDRLDDEEHCSFRNELFIQQCKEELNAIGSIKLYSCKVIE